MHNILSKHQFGFRESFSTELALIDIHEKLLSNFDNGLSSCAIFLDLAKASDSVSYDILIKKLEKYGVRGLPLKFFRSCSKKFDDGCWLVLLINILKFLEVECTILYFFHT